MAETENREVTALNRESAEDAELLLLRNLKDAGCSPLSIERFLCLHRDGRLREQLHLLARRRTALLKEIHGNQKKVDCLDYLIYRLKQNNGQQGDALQ